MSIFLKFLLVLSSDFLIPANTYPDVTTFTNQNLLQLLQLLQLMSYTITLHFHLGSCLIYCLKLSSFSWVTALSPEFCWCFHLIFMSSAAPLCLWCSASEPLCVRVGICYYLRCLELSINLQSDHSCLSSILEKF